MNDQLERFVKAQQRDYQIARLEIKYGKKRNHWMWYIFPQIEGLGRTTTSNFYAIKDKMEAEAFLQHPILGARLIEISGELLKSSSDDAHLIFGSPDDLKLRSSMTLFSSLPLTDPVFQLVLDKFFDGKKDERTLQIIDSGVD